MGTTYSNCQVRSDSQDAVAEALTPLLKEPAYVSPSVGGWVGVYPEGDNADVTEKLAKKLSAKLACGVFFWSVYDSDIFFYTLYEDGKLRDKFDSNPNYFEPVTKAKKTSLSGKPEALIPYCLPGIGYSEVQEVLHPAELAEPNAALAALPGFSDGNLQIMAKALNTTLDALKKGIDQKKHEKYIFADDQATDLAALLGISGELMNADFSVIAEGALEDLPQEDFQLTGSWKLSQEDKNEKLWYAVSLENMKSAIKVGADVNARDRSGVPPLVKAAHYCAIERMQLLMSNGANVNAATLKIYPGDPPDSWRLWNGTEDGATPLMAAAGASREHPSYPAEAIQLLLDAGADINVRTETGKTALSEALKMTDPKQHQGCIGRIAPEDVLRKAAEQSVPAVELLRAAGATE